MSKIAIHLEQVARNQETKSAWEYHWLLKLDLGAHRGDIPYCAFERWRARKENFAGQDDVAPDAPTAVKAFI